MDITEQELRLLTVFFRTTAPHLGLKGKTGLRDGYAESPLFIKNLELLRSLIDAGMDYDGIKYYCRACRNKITWITEAIPKEILSAVKLSCDLTPNKPIHRLLITASQPIERLEFMGSGSTVINEPEVRINPFTLGDLNQHFCSSFSLKDDFAGAFKFLLSKYDIDTILFAIDYAVLDSADIDNPLELKNLGYIKEAQDEVRHRRSRCQ